MATLDEKNKIIYIYIYIYNFKEREKKRIKRKKKKKSDLGILAHTDHHQMIFQKLHQHKLKSISTNPNQNWIGSSTTVAH